MGDFSDPFLASITAQTIKVSEPCYKRYFIAIIKNITFKIIKSFCLQTIELPTMTAVENFDIVPLVFRHIFIAPIKMQTIPNTTEIIAKAAQATAYSKNFQNFFKLIGQAKKDLFKKIAQQ